MFDNLEGLNIEYNLILCTPTLQELDYINYYDIDYNPSLRDVNRLSFSVPFELNKDGKRIPNPFYDYLDGDYIVVLEQIIDGDVYIKEAYTIVNPQMVGVDEDVKRIECRSLEYKFNRKVVRVLSGTLELVNNSNNSIMDMIIKDKLNNSWSLGYVNSELYGVFRTFDITERTLTQVFADLEDAFSCIFDFDSYNKIINIYKNEELGAEVDVYIDEENYLTSLILDTPHDDVITRLYVNGAGETVVNSANPTGMGYIDDFTHYRNLKYMTQSLLDALNDYDTLLANADGQFQILLAEVNSIQNDLDNLYIELFQLELDLILIEDNQDIAIAQGSSSGQNYAHWFLQGKNKQTQINDKKTQIENTELLLDSVFDDINDLRNLVRYENNFTVAQLKELNFFVHESSERFNTDNPNQLYEMGVEKLKDLAIPKREFAIGVLDFFKSIGITERYTNIPKLVKLGNFINISYNKQNFHETLRLLSYNHRIDANELQLVFSNKDKIDNSYSFIKDLQDKSNNASNRLEAEQEIYKQYEKDKEAILKQNQPIDSGSNEIIMGDGSVISRRGQFMRDLPGANGQMRVLGDRIVFTQDNWENISVGITSAGIFTNNEFVLDMATQTSDGMNRILLNPVDGIKIQKANGNTWTDVFYADSNGNLNLKGNITMDGGFIQWNGVNSDPEIGVAKNMTINLTGTLNDIFDNAVQNGTTIIQGGFIKTEFINANAIAIGDLSDGNAVWNQIDTAQSTANSAQSSADVAANIATGLANGTYSGTFINGNSVISPNIIGGIITGARIRATGTVNDELVMTSGGMRITSTVGSQFFSIARDGIVGFNIGTSGPPVRFVSGNSVDFNGGVDFTNATVTGLTLRFA